MKKIMTLLLVLAAVFFIFPGCGEKNGETGNGSGSPEIREDEETPGDPDSQGKEETEKDPQRIRLGGLKGPTSMGMVKLLDDAEKNLTGNDYAFRMAASADELTPALLKGELDIAAVPANLGAVLYQNSEGGVKTLALNTLGVVYIIEKGGEEIHGITDLKGRTILATGRGSAPEFALRYLLRENGLDPEKDLTVEWKSEPSEVVAQMASMDHAIAMMPQPFVTVARSKLEDLRIAVDMTEAWDETGNGSRFITAALIVRSDFAEEHPEALRKFMEEYAASAEYVNQNPGEAAMLIEKYDIVNREIAEKAIPYCNIVCIAGEEMKEALSGYLEVLYGFNPKSVGGSLPGDDFYLIQE